MKKVIRVLIFLFVQALCVSSVAFAGPLYKHPTNGRYFTDGSGKAIYLTGSHTWNTLQDFIGSWWFTPNIVSREATHAQGFTKYLDFLEENNHNFIRIWALDFSKDFTDGGTVSPHPWQRPTGYGNALDGLPKFNLDLDSTVNQAYFTRLRNYALAAGQRVPPIYVSIMIFGGTWGTEHQATWQGHAFNVNNNINGINGDPNLDGVANGTEELYTLSLTQAVDKQKAMIRKVVDAVNDLDNVLFEIANELRANNTPWQFEMVNYLKSYEAGKPKQHPVGMTGYATIPNSDLFGSTADWISPSQQSGSDYQNNPPSASGSKVIIVDTDHLWGEGGNRQWVWKSFTRGLNPIYMERITKDANDLPNADSVRKAMGDTLTYAGKMNLAAMTPQNSLASTAYCLANAGSEYLVYQPGSGGFTLNLTGVTGTFNIEWFNPATGVAASGGTTTGGASRSLTPPFSGDAVAYLKVTGTTDTTPPGAPGTVRDGATAGTDISSTTSTVQLSANWTASTDAESGISNYQYAIGLTPGGSQTAGWTTLGNVLTVTRTGLSLTIGSTYYFSVKAINGAGLAGTAANSNGQVVLQAVQSPYHGSPFAVPCKIEAEDYDLGGEMVAYHDTDTVNNGGQYRVSEGVDIEAATDAGAGYNVSTTRAGEWLEYTVNVSVAGNYDIDARVACNVATGGGNFHIEFGGVNKTGTLTLPYTGGWQVWATLTKRVNLSAGRQVMRIAMDTGGATGAIGNFNYVEIKAVAADTTPPGAPGAVRDGATAGTDISSTTSRTQLSANWTQSADVESGISGYSYAIGTTAGGTNITNWVSLGNVLTVTKTGLTLTTGTTYYFSVKAVNGVGLTGSAANSNGQVVLSTVTPDTTAPSAPGIVRDGPTAGTDAVSTYSTTTLSANWTASTDNESGITNYQFSIGTTPGATNITNWTAMGNVLAATKTGLNLTTGSTYYFSVKATNGAGLTGSATNSNGQYINALNTADTTAPSSIAQVRDGNETGTDASVTYLTDELSANWSAAIDNESGISNYQFSIGTTPGGTDVVPWTDNGELTSVTQIGLTLTVGTIYYFSVKAENGVSLQSDLTSSDGQLVLSMDSQGPLISNVSAQGITNEGATIAWETDEPSTSRVEYGLTASYGSLTGEYIGMNTEHSVTLAGLQPETQYHYRVISRDYAGNESVSSDCVFTMLSTPTEVTEVKAYPNPCDFRNGQVVKFKVGAGGSQKGEVKIYTMTGKLVKVLSGTSEISWDGTNENNQKVSRGVYIYTLTNGRGDKIAGKIAVTK